MHSVELPPRNPQDMIVEEKNATEVLLKVMQTTRNKA